MRAVKTEYVNSKSNKLRPSCWEDDDKNYQENRINGKSASTGGLEKKGETGWLSDRTRKKLRCWFIITFLVKQ